MPLCQSYMQCMQSYIHNIILNGIVYTILYETRESLLWVKEKKGGEERRSAKFEFLIFVI